MHRLLLIAAASAAALIGTSPALAQSVAAAGFSSSYASSRIHALVGRPAGGNFHGVRVHRGHGRDGFPGIGYYSSGYNDPGDFDANRSFDPDKWNDWWHERPERAFPRWMSRNQDCARQWYSADVLTC